MSKTSSNISNQLDPKHIEDVDITDDIINIPNDDDAPLMGFSSLNRDIHLNGGREDAKEQNIENKNQWNIKQTFSKNNPFNDTQLGIIYNVMKDGNEDIKVFEPDDELKPPSNDDTYYGINRYNFELETLFTCKYKIVENVCFKDFMMTVFDYVNEGKVLLIQNQYKAKIFMSVVSIMDAPCLLRRHAPSITKCPP